MARENQGLQIALIICVMVIILLGVMTFFFFGQSQEQAKKAEKFEDSLSKEQNASKLSISELNKLKQTIGFAPSDNMDVITAQVKTDMQTYGANYPEDAHAYRKLLQYMQTVIDERNASLTSERQEIQTMKNRIDEMTGEHKMQMAQAKAGQATAAKDLQGERVKFDSGIQAAGKTMKNTETIHKTAVMLANTNTTKAKTLLAKANTDLAKSKSVIKDKITIIKKFLKPTPDVPDGNICAISPHENAVYLNLGRADGLGLHTSFSVFSPDTSDVSEGKKGSVEVTQILGDHLSKARMLDFDYRNLMTEGDLVHTPIWSPGEREHFALTSGMDVDDNGSSEPQVVRNLITMSGGVIDAEIDDKGNRTGEMTSKTRYLITGRRVDANSSPEVINSHTHIIKEAKSLGIETITLEKFLAQAGWKNRTPVIDYSKGADFRAPPTEGVRRTSTGDVSPLYRRPPRDAKGSAFD